MTDDIVARLRSGFISPTCALDAADEITRLRADLAAARALLEEAREWIDMGDEIIAMRIVARIDAALAKGEGRT